MTCRSKRFNKKGSQKFGYFFWLEIVGFCWLNLIEKNPTLFLIADFVAKLYLQLVLDVFLPTCVNQDEGSVEMTSDISTRSGGCILPSAMDLQQKPTSFCAHSMVISEHH